MLTAVLTQGALVMPCPAQADRDAAAAQYTATLATSVRTSNGPGAARDGVMTIRVQGDRARVDYAFATPGLPAGSYILFDAGRMGTTLVVPAQKAFIVLDSSTAGGMLQQANEMLKPRSSAVTWHRDSLGAGETLLGFASRKFRMGMGMTMDVSSGDFAMSVRTETEVEMHVSEAIAALAPGFGALGRAPGGRNTAGSFTNGIGALLHGDSVVLRAIASMAPPRGFPLVQVSTQRTIMRGDTTTTTTAMRLTSFERTAVPSDVFSVPAGFTPTDMMSLARKEFEARPPE